MNTVRYHEMLPFEIRVRRRRFPVGFVGLGTLEWHGEHAAVGLDGLKAERLCELAALASGGFSFPTLWYGEPRSLEHMDRDQPESTEIRSTLGLRAAVPARDEGRSEVEEFQCLVKRVVVQIYEAGMRVVCVMCGHFPMYAWAEPVCQELDASWTQASVLVGTEVHFVDSSNTHAGPPLAGNDHAGAWESSYLMHLRPNCIDMDVYDGTDLSEPLLGVLGDDPRASASPDTGALACAAIVEGMVARATNSLEQLA